MDVSYLLSPDRPTHCSKSIGPRRLDNNRVFRTNFENDRNVEFEHDVHQKLKSHLNDEMRLVSFYSKSNKLVCAEYGVYFETKRNASKSLFAGDTDWLNDLF